MNVSNSEVSFSDEFNQALNERGKVWSALDAARNASNKIQSIGAGIEQEGSPDPISHLTEAATPPDEIHATLTALEAELHRIAEDQGTIQANNDQIAQIKRKIQNRWNIFFGSVGVLVMVSLCVLMQMFT
jgi:hypothetical protein